MEKMINELDTKLSIDKPCTMCHKKDLIKLPPELQVYSRRKKFISYFCTNCLQIINFIEQ